MHIHTRHDKSTGASTAPVPLKPPHLIVSGSSRLGLLRDGLIRQARSVQFGLVISCSLLLAVRLVIINKVHIVRFFGFHDKIWDLRG